MYREGVKSRLDDVNQHISQILQAIKFSKSRSVCKPTHKSNTPKLMDSFKSRPGVWANTQVRCSKQSKKVQELTLCIKLTHGSKALNKGSCLRVDLVWGLALKSDTQIIPNDGERCVRKIDSPFKHTSFVRQDQKRQVLIMWPINMLTSETLCRQRVWLIHKLFL